MGTSCTILFTFHYASTLSVFRCILNRDKKNLHSTMLLLYRTSSGRRTPGHWKFTFHYASTLSEKIGGEKTHRLNLHSTMLLLYPALLAPELFPMLHLHSTMLLLYRWVSCIAASGKADLHSTMLLLYPKAGQSSTSRTTIYLHSTMLLLYLCQENGGKSAIFIYIPLCFYFIEQAHWCRGGELYHLHSTMLVSR